MQMCQGSLAMFDASVLRVLLAEALQEQLQL